MGAARRPRLPRGGRTVSHRGDYILMVVALCIAGTLWYAYVDGLLWQYVATGCRHCRVALRRGAVIVYLWILCWDV